MEAVHLNTVDEPLRVVPIRSSGLLRAAHIEARNGQRQRAADLYQAHLRHHPDDLQAWMSLGVLMRQHGDFERALLCHHRALRLRPDSAAVWSNLASLWSEMEQHEQAMRCHRRAFEIAPEASPIRLARARGLREASRFEEALAEVDHCLQMVPGRADLRMLRAELLLHLDRWSEGLLEFESRILLEPALQAQADCPRWQGQNLQGRRLLLLAEQGYGMSLTASRFITALARRGTDITFVCDSSLHPVLQALPAALISKEQRRRKEEVFDYQCPLWSLPRLLEPGGRSIPEPSPIPVSPRRRSQYQVLCGDTDCFKLGVVWSPSPALTENRKRAFEFERLHYLAHLPGVQMTSLQRGLPAQQLRESDWGRRVTDLNLMLQDFGETAAAISVLDMLVTCDCAVAHLAASMRKPVLLLLNYRPYWLYGTRNDWTPWYPSMRIIRQPEPGDWDSVMKEANALITAMAKQRLQQQTHNSRGQ